MVPTLVRRIHDTPHKGILAITGGGSEVVSDLLRYGGGSTTVLDAVVPYANSALDKYLGGPPDKYCSADTARNMAMASYQRARLLSPETPLEHLFGLGVTCSLGKYGPERPDRKHLAFVSYQTHDTTYTFEAEIEHHDRHEEEALVAQVSLQVIGMACGFEKPDWLHRNPGWFKSVFESEERPFNPLVYRLVNGLTEVTSIVINPHARERPKVLLPGSFNPIHKCHLKMAQASFEGAGGEATKGVPVDLEISVLNVDKPALNYYALNRRIEQITAETAGKPYVGQLYLTRSPTFKYKSKLFARTEKGVVFLVGQDTLRRLDNPKYCEPGCTVARDLLSMEIDNTTFLAFHRLGEEPVRLNPQLEKMTTKVPETVFQDDGTSSSKIRKDCQ